MKARLCLVASLLLFAGQAMAEDPSAAPGDNTPATTEQMAPAAPPAAPAATEPAPAPTPQTEAMSPDPAPAPQKEAATPEPAPAPAPQAATPEPAPAPQKEAATPEPAPAPQKEAAAPAEIVITELTEVEDDKKLVAPWALPVDSVEEMDVYDANGNKIGEVDAVLQDKNGEIKGVAIEYGGFLGFGEKGAVLTFDQLTLKDGTIVTELTEDQLPDQPAWDK